MENVYEKWSQSRDKVHEGANAPEKLLLVRQSRLSWCWELSHHWKPLGKQLFTFLLPSLCSCAPVVTGHRAAGAERAGSQIPAAPSAPLLPEERCFTLPCSLPRTDQDHNLSTAPQLPSHGASIIPAPFGARWPCSGAPCPALVVHLCHCCSINSAPSAPHALCT